MVTRNENVMFLLFTEKIKSKNIITEEVKQQFVELGKYCVWLNFMRGLYNSLKV